MKRALLIIKSLLLTSLLIGFIWAIMQVIPPAWKPWIPFTIDQPMDAEIQSKLQQLPARNCLSILTETAPEQVQYAVLSDHQAPPDCELQNVLLVHRTTLDLPQPMIIQCPILVSWLMFEQQQLQPLAQQHLGSEVKKLRLYSSFSCRNVYGRSSGKRSQHADAAALDIGGFGLQDGSEISVLNDWPGDDKAATFLKAVRDQACGYFGTVLGPEYNTAHRDHFHLDLTDSGLCQ